MEIRVSAPDSKIANLAILKIAAYHIAKGDHVDWYAPLFDTHIDRLYISKVFTFTDDMVYLPNCEVVKGGTGYDVKSVLPDEIEQITDISEAYELLYPNIDYSIIFTTRGCVRNCEFCLVPRKEGMIHDVHRTTLNPNGKHVKVLDNNFFSSKTWKTRFDYLKSLNQPIDFNQGIDIRAITDEQAKMLSEISIYNTIHFAWDRLEDEKAVLAGIKRLTEHIIPRYLTCYVLVGFESSEITESDHYRIEKLHELGITPFAMGFIDYTTRKERSESVKDFCRWVNRHLFKNVPFSEYDTSVRG